MKLAILLTGTIKPSVVGGNFSVEERKKMYEGTLLYYAKVIGKDYPLVFVENSDTDLSWIAPLKYQLSMEVLQFNPQNTENLDFDTSKGKGYNEFLMIKKAVGVSHYLNEVTHILKITGRYPMLNIRTIIAEIEKRVQNRNIVYMGDIKDTCIYKLMGIKTISSSYGDCRFFVVQKNFYIENLADCYKEMNDYIEGQWAEDFFVRLSRRYRKDKRFIFRFRHQVQIDGISGVVKSKEEAIGNMNYNSRQSQLKNKLRYILRIICPGIWF